MKIEGKNWKEFLEYIFPTKGLNWLIKKTIDPRNIKMNNWGQKNSHGQQSKENFQIFKLSIEADFLKVTAFRI